MGKRAAQGKTRRKDYLVKTKSLAIHISIIAAFFWSFYPSRADSAQIWVYASPVCLGTPIAATYQVAQGELGGYDDLFVDFYQDDEFIARIDLEDGGDGFYYAGCLFESTSAREVVIGGEACEDDDTWSETSGVWYQIALSPATVRVGVGKTRSIASVIIPSSAAASGASFTATSKATVSPSSSTQATTTLTVSGVTASESNGDTSVQGSLSGLGCSSSVAVTVTVPSTCSQSSPALSTQKTQIPNTFSIQWGPANVNITVFDQFGVQLDASWNGTTCYESVDGSDPPTAFSGSLQNGVFIDPCLWINHYPDQQSVDEVLQGIHPETTAWKPDPAISHEVLVGSYALTPIWLRQLRLYNNLLSVRNLAE